MELFWFAFDIPRYESKTSHLTMLQDGAYGRLMRHYYKTCLPIPANEQQIVILAKAFSVDEIEAVSFVLKAFFHLEVDGWHNYTCDEEIAKCRRISNKRRKTGKLGGLAKARNLLQQTPSKHLDNNNNNNKEEPKVKSVRSRFEPPALGEVIAYCQERGGHVDGQQWFNYYTANGWKIGRNAMRDWRASVRYWEKNGNGTSGQVNKQSRAKQVAHNNLAAFAAAMGGAALDFGAVSVQGTNTARNQPLEGEVKRLLD